MRETITSVFEEFVRSIGGSTQSPEMIRLDIENNYIFTAERVNDEEVVMSVINNDTKSNVVVYEYALDLCRLESRSKLPLRAGLLQNDLLVLSSRVSAEWLDVTNFYSALRKLVLCHNRISGVVIL